MVRKLRWLLPSLLVLGMTQPLWAAEAPADQPGLVTIDWSEDIWVLISFALVYFILYKFAWKNVLESLKARERRITGSIQQAEETRAKAEALLKEHEARIAGAEDQVRQLLQSARTDAEKIAANIRAQAQTEGEAERDRTRKEIEAAKRDAIRQVYEQTADLAVNVAAKIIGRNLNPADQAGLVNETLNQLQAAGHK